MSEAQFHRHESVSRRSVLRNAAGLAMAGAAAWGAPGRAPAAETSAAGGAGEKPIRKGRIRQSLVQWCFQPYWDLDALCAVAKKLGCTSVELVEPKDWPILKQHGLTCAIAPNGMPGAPFVKGFNNPKYHDEIIAVTRKTIDACADFGVKTVIAFTGYKWRDAEDPKSGEISLEEGADSCVKGLKRLCDYAEKKDITVALEILNTRATDHPMKGHPGYQGDHTDYVMDFVKRVGSPSMKVLFDVYHVQIMDGDVIRRVRQYKDLIGHVHLAGNPGRGELDAAQEINFPPILETLLEAGYTGFVGQEYIPTRDPWQGLVQACSLCDV